jgi:hypothetical protein
LVSLKQRVHPLLKEVHNVVIHTDPFPALDTRPQTL